MNLPALYTLFTSALLSPKVVFSQQSTILFPSLCSVEHKHVFIFIIFHNKMFFVVFFFYYYFYAFFNLHVNQLLEGGKTHMCSRPVVTFMKTQKGKRLKKNILHQQSYLDLERTFIKSYNLTKPKSFHCIHFIKITGLGPHI